MTNFTACFSDGSAETRTSKAAYTHGWKLYRGAVAVTKGFSTSEQRAVKAAATARRFYRDAIAFGDGEFRVEVVEASSDTAWTRTNLMAGSDAKARWAYEANVSGYWRLFGGFEKARITKGSKGWDVRLLKDGSFRYELVDSGFDSLAEAKAEVEAVAA